MNQTKPWTKAEEDELIMLVAAGKTNKEIAEALGRSKGAVAHKRVRMFGAIEEPQGTVGAEQESKEAELERRITFLEQELKRTAAELEGTFAALCMETHELNDKVDMDRSVNDTIFKGIADFREAVNEYLSHGPLWRLFHGFKAFLAKFAEKRGAA